MDRKKRKGLDEGRAAEGLACCQGMGSRATPRYMESEVIAPIRTIGVGSMSSLNAAFWHSTIEEWYQVGDPNFASIALNTEGGRGSFDMSDACGAMRKADLCPGGEISAELAALGAWETTRS